LPKIRIASARSIYSRSMDAKTFNNLNELNEYHRLDNAPLPALPQPQKLEKTPPPSPKPFDNLYLAAIIKFVPNLDLE